MDLGPCPICRTTVRPATDQDFYCPKCLCDVVLSCQCNSVLILIQGVFPKYCYICGTFIDISTIQRTAVKLWCCKSVCIGAVQERKPNGDLPKFCTECGTGIKRSDLQARPVATNEVRLLAMNSSADVDKEGQQLPVTIPTDTHTACSTDNLIGKDAPNALIGQSEIDCSTLAVACDAGAADSSALITTAAGKLSQAAYEYASLPVVDSVCKPQIADSLTCANTAGTFSDSVDLQVVDQPLPSSSSVRTLQLLSEQTGDAVRSFEKDLFTTACCELELKKELPVITGDQSARGTSVKFLVTSIDQSTHRRRESRVINRHVAVTATAEALPECWSLLPPADVSKEAVAMYVPVTANRSGPNRDDKLAVFFEDQISAEAHMTGVPCEAIPDLQFPKDNAFSRMSDLPRDSFDEEMLLACNDMSEGEDQAYSDEHMILKDVPSEISGIMKLTGNLIGRGSQGNSINSVRAIDRIFPTFKDMEFDRYDPEYSYEEYDSFQVRGPAKSRIRRTGTAPNISNRKNVDVYFHANIPESFSFDENSDRPFIELYSNRLDDESIQRPLEHHNLPSGRIGWLAAIRFSQELCSQGQSLQYRYFIKHSNTSALENTYERIYEVAQGLKRQFRLSDIPADQDKWDQYDFVMLPDNCSPSDSPPYQPPLLQSVVNGDAAASGSPSSRLYEPGAYELGTTNRTLYNSVMSDTRLESMLPDFMYCIFNGNMKASWVIECFHDVIRCFKNGNLYFLDEAGRSFSKRCFRLVLLKQLDQLARQQEKPSCQPGDQSVECDRHLRLSCIASGLALIVLTPKFRDDTMNKHIPDILASLNTSGLSQNDIQEFVQDHFTSIPALVTPLRYLMMEAARSGNPSWFCAVPLYHIFQKWARTYDRRMCDYDAPEWWGLDNKLDGCMSDFMAHAHGFKAKEWYQVVSPMFGVSWLSARTFVGALTNEQLLSALHEGIPLPVDSYIAAILRKCFSETTQKMKPEDCADAVDCLLQILHEVHSTAENTTTDTAAPLMNSMEIIVVALRKAKVMEFRGWQLILRLLPFFVALFSHPVLSKDKPRDSRLVARFFDGVSEWLSFVLPSRVADTNATTLDDPSELKIWQLLFELTWQDEEICDAWIKRLREGLLHRLEKVSQFTKVALYCLTDFSNKDVENLFADLALQAADDVMSLRNANNSATKEINFNSNGKILKKYGKVFSFGFNKAWDRKSADSSTKLEFILSWPGFPTFVELTCLDHADVLDETCQGRIVECVNLLTERFRMLSGDITYSELCFLIEHSSRFTDICKRLSEKQLLDKKVANDVEKLLELRKRQKVAFDELHDSLSIFITLCGNDVQLQGLPNQVHADISKKPIEELWVTERPCELECRYFPLTKNILRPDRLTLLKKVHGSFLFMSYWNASKQLMKEQQHNTNVSTPGDLIQLDHVLDNIWEQAHQSYKNFASRLTQGIATFGDAEYLIKQCHTGSQNIEKEIFSEVEHLMPSSQDWQEVAKRVVSYNNLKLYAEGAKIMRNLKDRFHLQGDFSALDVLITWDRHPARKLNDITDQLVGAGKRLKVLADPPKVDCLAAFVECRELTDWIKLQVAEPKELKVFVDLATTMAEGDIAVEQVTCLHDAFMGYTPLIYELPESADLQVFLEKCEAVWKNLEVNRDLATQLRDTARNINFFKSVKDSYGSVELTSLAQAEVLNEEGTYNVGFVSDAKSGYQSDALDSVLQAFAPDKRKVVSVNNDQVTRDSQMRLITDEMSVAEKKKKYSYSALSELQSKLMLVAGHSKQDNPEVDEFFKMFLNVTRLAQAFVRANDAGTIIFEKWQLEFNCEARSNDERRKSYTRVFFGLSGETSEIIQCLSSRANRAHHADKLADFLEECIREWQMYIQQQRHKYHELNFFTTRQLVFLRKELAKCVVLRSVERKCSNMVFPLLAMLVRCDWKDIAEALRATYQEALDSRSQKSPGVEVAHTLNMEYNQTSFDDLISMLRKRWKDFLSGALSDARDCLSMERLSEILRHLASKNAKASPTLQKPQHEFADEQSNVTLIVCPEDEILHAVLSLYMVRPERKMPTRNEVLVCTEQTSLEEVELLLQRAVVYGSSLYTIAYAHRLGYEICGHIEKRIEDFKTHENKYCIAVVCAEESEDFSRITTALERFRTRRFVREPLEKLQDFVQEHLHVPDDCERPSAGKFIDSKRCAARVIQSRRAGLGKTLYVRRCISQLQSKLPTARLALNVQLLQQCVDVSVVLNKFLQKCDEPENDSCRLIHINIAQEVHYGVNEFLFNLLILGSICHPEGYVWQRSQYDYYAIEMVPLMKKIAEGEKSQALHSVIELLPTLSCASPTECYQFYSQHTASGSTGDLWQEMDDQIFQSEEWQRTYQYLKRHKNKASYLGVDGVNTSTPEDTPKDMLHLLLDECKLADPSWSELRHFVNFLSTQLHDCERSAFCCGASSQDLPGFLEFVVLFMLLMSREFATRSLFTSNVLPDDQLFRPQPGSGESFLGATENMQRWESSSHPYIFFNADGQTLTFLGFCIDRPNGHILVPGTQKILLKSAVKKELYAGLDSNKVELMEEFENKSREEKILKMSSVMGIDSASDPDSTYELTLDNVKKILAIHMRFRCGIPVVIMGETGCGKTRLVKFMCDLQIPFKQRETTKNLILMKVHGGTTAQHVEKMVREAQELAKRNAPLNVDTVLFFDEANTTDAIGLIKEVMCDDSLNGEPLYANDIRLRFIAAVNPYRKHSCEMIEQLEKAGLGYNVKADKTFDKFGSIPMRHLVYRVRALPESMIPLVWDFGSLHPDVEKKYIGQMIKHYNLPGNSDVKDVMVNVLVSCQNFMRAQKDECSFVSLRDIDRVLRVMSWFHDKHELFQQRAERSTESSFQQAASLSMISDQQEHTPSTPLFEVSTVSQSALPTLDPVTWSLVLALGVCYHACLQPRKQGWFRRDVGAHFKYPLVLPRGDRQILEEVEKCQEVILQSLNDLPSTNFARENIAGNHALKENIFIMVVCLELRIPLFIVGKPGSSKSLAKAIVTHAMQGRSSMSNLFKNLKEVHMVSFQCSPLATPEGIVGTFKLCASFQKNKNLDEFVSVVVLDEVGLAEDSKLMPLKALHPLLDEGCDADEKPERYMKCAFIGISNWSLDPAKMNRGIRVQRGVPERNELQYTACGICNHDKRAFQAIEKCIGSMSTAYVKIFDDLKDHREFFGLRDFYSLMKMVAYFASKSGGMPTPYQLRHAILRNFGGVERLDVMTTFERHLRQWLQVSADSLPSDDDPPIDAIGLIDSSLTGIYTRKGGESRYLLVITENDTALSLIQSKLQKCKPEVIFGSNFSKDLQYTQVCRNINRIKVCMEAGKTLVLLNLENLYESLYDALNQYYVYLGGKRFVDLGLGTHRVKCRVHENFRLLVIADKEAVYTRFPTPLINRLEKHYVQMSSLLSKGQQDIAEQLCTWASNFVQMKDHSPGLQKEQALNDRACTPEDAFVGYSADGVAGVILQIRSDFQEHSTDDEQIRNIKRAKLVKRAKEILLWSATPDAVLRVKQSQLSDEYAEIFRTYFEEQRHSDFNDLLGDIIKQKSNEDLFWQVTTHYRLLSRDDVSHIEGQLGSNFASVKVIYSLQAVDTEQQFSREIRDFYKGTENSGLDSLLIVQCESGHENVQLISCARYIIWSEYNDSLLRLESPDCSEPDLPTTGRRGMRHVVLIVQLQRKAAFCGLQGANWTCIHVENLHLRKPSLPTMKDVHLKSISEILSGGMSAPQQAMKSHVLTDEKELPKETPFNTYELLRSCLHEAVSRLTDVSEGSTVHDESLDRAKSRSRARLTRLIDLFSLQSPTGCVKFQELFCRFLILLMNIYEKKRELIEEPSLWLFSDAACFHNVINFGTFRRSLENCLERRIAPLFATLVAFIDTNCNLDLLTSHGTFHVNHWHLKLWLEIFGGIEPFIPDLLQALAVSGVQKHEIPVICTSASNESFSPCFPFSWLLKEKLDALIVRFKNIPDVHLHEALQKELDKDPTFGSIISHATEDHADMTESYLRDFVHLAYPCESKRHELHEIIYFSLKQVMRARVLETIPGVHICFAEVQRHIHRFRQIVDLEIHEPGLANGEPSLEMGVLTCLRTHQLDPPEMICDAVALKLTLERIDPLPFLEKGCVINWSEKMHVCHEIVEEILSDSSICVNEIERYNLLNESRKKWWRYLVLRLFLELIINQSKQYGLPAVFGAMELKILSQSLVELSDFKNLSALQALENFLEFCNQKLMEGIYGKHVLTGMCCRCGRELRDPVVLPCLHLICNLCLQSLLGRQEEEIRCPLQSCNTIAPIGSAYSSNNDPERQSIKHHHNFKKLFNSFFVCVLVELAFSGDQQPDAAVCKHILKYVTVEQHSTDCKAIRTKQLSPFMDVSLIDPTPVIRSLLLQLLLRASEGIVNEYLSEYFNKITRITECFGRLAVLESCMLFVTCFEDYLAERHLRRDDAYVPPAVSQETFKFLSEVLQPASQMRLLFDEVQQLNVEALRSIAALRLCLVVGAELICTNVTNKRAYVSFPDRTSAVAQLLSDICDYAEEKGNSWPRQFLAKQIIRKYGATSFHVASSMQYLQFIVPKRLQHTARHSALPDLLVIGLDHDLYEQMRYAIVCCIEHTRMDALQTLITERSDSNAVLDLYCVLSVCSVFVRRYFDSSSTNCVQEEIIMMIEQYVVQRWPEVEVFQLLLAGLVKNLLADKLRIVAHSSLRDTMIAMLVHRLGLGLLIKERQNSALMNPLAKIIYAPLEMREAYFPTMPHDPFLEVNEAMKELSVGLENLSPYECSNGHKYICNLGKCPECGEAIGEDRQGIVEGNPEVRSSEDNIKPGHVLGVAASSKQLVGERDLVPLSCLILRIVLHIALYVSAVIHGKEKVEQLVHPKQENVLQFLWDHLKHDIECLQSALNKSFDDSLIFLHAVVAQFVTFDEQGDCNWQNHTGRWKWENRIQECLLLPVCQEVDHIIAKGTSALRSDKNGNAFIAALLMTVDETHAVDADEPEVTKVEGKRIAEQAEVSKRDTPILGMHESCTIDIRYLLNSAAMWRYRESPSVDHFIKRFESYCSTYSTTCKDRSHNYAPLKKFLHKRVHLAAIRFLPDILSLTIGLSREFGRKIDLITANQLTIGHFFENHVGGRHRYYQPLLHSFYEAWNTVRAYLPQHHFWYRGDVVTAPMEPCASTASDSSPLRMLLAGLRGPGLCIMALITYLAKVQNKFLNKYALISREVPQKGVPLLSVVPVQLIAFEESADLLPIVLCYCEYSQKAGEDIIVNYDFEGIQQRIVNRFVRHKPLILVASVENGGVDEIQPFLFREDLANSSQLGKLHRCLPQKPLTPDLKEALLCEYRGKVSDLSEILVVIDQAIGFLVTSSISDDSNRSLVNYLQTVLHMPDISIIVMSTTLRDRCYLCHVRAVWLLLSLERAKALTKNNQECFYNIDNIYCQPIEKEQETTALKLQSSLKKRKHKMSADKVSEIMYEFIVLELACKRRNTGSGRDLEEDEKSWPLFGTLVAYAEKMLSNGYDGYETVAPNLTELEREYNGLQLQHSASVWRMMCDM